MSNQLITAQEELQQLCKQLEDNEWVAVDTEFLREKTYYPQLCLIQLANSEHAYCIDPLALKDLGPLFELLDKPDITKVFHAAGQDLEIFYHLRQRLPEPIFDTQVAAALLGYGEQIGYAALVKSLLNMELDKSSTRTDWQQRPLQDKQLQYALNDVRYLAELYPVMQAQLQRKGRLEWMDNEQKRLLATATYEVDLKNCWQRIKGANKLKRRQLNILKHLAGWREQIAADRNKPRRWIISDDVLLNISLQKPRDIEQLRKTRQLEPRTADRYAETLLQLIQTAEGEPPESWPAGSRSRKPTTNEEAMMDLLSAVIRIRAAEHELSAGQLSSRGELYQLLQGERDLPLLRGWRLHIAGQAVLDALAGRIQPGVEQGIAVLKDT